MSDKLKHCEAANRVIKAEADEERILRERYYAQRNYAQELADQIADWATLWKRAAKKWYSLATIGAEYGAENSHIADEFLAELNEARERLNELEAERDKWREDCQNQIQAGTQSMGGP